MGRRCTPSSIASLPSIRSPTWRSKVTSAWHLYRCRDLWALWTPRCLKLNERLRPQPPLLLTKKCQWLTSDIHSVSPSYVCLLCIHTIPKQFLLESITSYTFHKGNSQIIRSSKFLYWIEFCSFGSVRLVEKIKATAWGEGRLKKKNPDFCANWHHVSSNNTHQMIMLWNRRTIWLCRLISNSLWFLS